MSIAELETLLSITDPGTLMGNEISDQRRKKRSSFLPFLAAATSEDASEQVSVPSRCFRLLRALQPCSAQPGLPQRRVPDAFNWSAVTRSSALVTAQRFSAAPHSAENRCDVTPFCSGGTAFRGALRLRLQP